MLNKKVSFYIKIIFTIAFVGYLVFKVDPAMIRADFSSVAWDYFWIGAALTLPNLLIQWLKWQYLVRMIDPDVSRRSVWRSLFAGFSIGLITPGRIGEMGKGIFIDSPQRKLIIGFGVIDKILSQIALAVFGAVSLLYLTEFVFDFNRPTQLIILVFVFWVVVALAVMIFRPSSIRWLIEKLKSWVRFLPWNQHITDVLSAADEFKRHHFWPSLHYALLFQWIVFIQIYCFANAFHSISFWEALSAAAAAMFVKALLPITLMDIGVREGALIFFLGRFGVDAASAFNTSVMIFASNVLLPGLIGVFFVYKFRWSREK